MISYIKGELTEGFLKIRMVVETNGYRIQYPRTGLGA